MDVDTLLGLSADTMLAVHGRDVVHVSRETGVERTIRARFSEADESVALPVDNAPRGQIVRGGPTILVRSTLVLKIGDTIRVGDRNYVLAAPSRSGGGLTSWKMGVAR